MKFIEKITGSDLTKTMEQLDQIVQRLPQDYQDAWVESKSYFWSQAEGCGCEQVLFLKQVVAIFEEVASDGRPVQEALGTDVATFCATLQGVEHGDYYHQKLRRQLNKTVAKKLGSDEDEIERSVGAKERF